LNLNGGKIINKFLLIDDYLIDITKVDVVTPVRYSGDYYQFKIYFSNRNIIDIWNKEQEELIRERKILIKKLTGNEYG